MKEQKNTLEMGALSLTILTSFEQTRDFIDQWDDFALRAGGSLYSSYDWCSSWWQYYGSGRNLRIILFFAGQDLAGAIPMFEERLWVGPLRIKIAKPLASDFTLALTAPAVDQRWSREIFTSLLKYFLTERHCDAVWFGPLAGDYEHTSNLLDVCRENSHWLHIKRNQISSPHISLSLPDTFNAYIQKLAKKERSNLRRRMKLFQQEYAIRVDMVTDPVEAERAYHEFLQMHSRQWSDRGKLGHFGDWPRAAEWNLTLLQNELKANRLRLFRLWADDQVVSYQLCYKFGDEYFVRHSARLEGQIWDRYSLGHVRIAKLAEYAIQEGVTRMEIGVGHYDYKLRLGGREHHLRSILVTRTSWLSRLRASLFCLVSDTLQLLYYKIWFCRLAPRLRIRTGPLWKCWIRTRL